jgi:hypothetical protein
MTVKIIYNLKFWLEKNIKKIKVISFDRSDIAWYHKNCDIVWYDISYDIRHCQVSCQSFQLYHCIIFNSNFLNLDVKLKISIVFYYIMCVTVCRKDFNFKILFTVVEMAHTK